MKSTVTVSMLLITTFLGTIAHAEVDAVKVQAVKQFVESFANSEITYYVKTNQYLGLIPSSRGSKIADLGLKNEYVITFLEGKQKQFDALDKQALHDILPSYLDDEKHSFTAAVLMMADTPFRPIDGQVGRPAPPFMNAILTDDKVSWDQTQKNEREKFLNTYSFSKREKEKEKDAKTER